jgi:hypothetical protein
MRGGIEGQGPSHSAATEGGCGSTRAGPSGVVVSRPVRIASRPVPTCPLPPDHMTDVDPAGRRLRQSTSHREDASVENLLQKGSAASMLWTREELHRLVYFDNLAMVHEDHSVCDLSGESHLVSDDEHRHAVVD